MAANHQNPITDFATLSNKDEIRRAMRERRRALTPEERKAASEIICAKLTAVIFGMEILLLCWGMASSHRYNFGPLFAACIFWLTFTGSVIAVRSRRWGYVLLLLVEFFLAGALIPACCATL